LPWYRRFGPYTALLEVLDRALGAVPDLDPVLRCKALGARGSTLRLLGRLDEAQVELERAIALAGELDAAVVGALIESELAQTLLEKDDHATARTVQERVLTVYRRHHQRVLEGHALLALGHMHYYVDDLEASQRSYEQALAVHREVGDRVYECEALRSLALVELELGRRGSARAHFEQALAAIESVNERRWRPHTLGYFAILEQEVGNHREATSLYTQAINEARLVGRWRAEAVFRGYLGTCLLEQGALDEARAELMRAIDDLGVFERMASRALFRACLAVIDTMRGEIEAAAREIELARAELDRSPEQVFLRRAVEIHAGHVELGRARAAAHASEHTESEALFTDARSLLETPGFAQSDVRFAQRMLERAVKGWVAPRRSRPWRVQETGLWFEPPYGTRVELGRKHALRRLLVFLAQRHAADDKTPLSAADLISAGWPGERIQKHAAANRLRVALHTLRRMGLADLLVTHADGYHFDPRASLELVTG
jgi:tetratricopeptide (TPR) repeat protein